MAAYQTVYTQTQIYTHILTYTSTYYCKKSKKVGWKVQLYDLQTY